MFPSRTFFGDGAKRELWSLFQSRVEPQCSVQPFRAGDVANILSVVRGQQCKFAVLGGGTAPFFEASNVQGGVTIDLQLMNSIILGDNNDTVQVGGGAIWAEVYRELDPYHLSSVGTRNSRTGVVGSILGGTFTEHA